jgi:FMN phosphatase YigB (HAD superfamily)
MRRVVAFDLGGVVVDVDFTALAALGPRDVVERAFFVGAGDRHDRLTVGAVSGDDYVAEVAADLGVDVDVVRTAWASVVRFSPGGQQLIAEVAARVPVAIWSNTDPIHWSVLSSSLQLAFDLAPSFALGAMKPQPAYFKRALARLPADVEVFFVDDRADNVDAAIAAGVSAQVVRGVEQARAACLAFLARPAAC